MKVIGFSDFNAYASRHLNSENKKDMEAIAFIG
jgi:hypothetical protein